MNVQEILSAMRNVDKTSISDTERKEMVLGATLLLQKMETPWDCLLRLIWVDFATLTALKTLVDLELFEKWVAGGGGPKTPEELGKMVGADPALILRLIRMLATQNIADNPGPDIFAMNDFSRSLAEPKQIGPLHNLFDSQMPAYLATPKFLKRHKYQNPASLPPSEAAVCDALDMRGKDLFQYWAERPEELSNFNNCMAGYASNATPWVDVFPTAELASGGDANDAVLVDVGGSIGHDVLHFQKKHSLPPGRVVLQDQPGVVANAVSPELYTPVGHDFFAEQPVKAARAYFLHSVCHDWPADKAAVILQRIRDAMDKDKSRVLLYEGVLLPQDNSSLTTQSDVLMMVLMNAMERTEKMWASLAAAAGLEIVKIHTIPTSAQSVIELRAA